VLVFSSHPPTHLRQPSFVVTGPCSSVAAATAVAAIVAAAADVAAAVDAVVVAADAAAAVVVAAAAAATPLVRARPSLPSPPAPACTNPVSHLALTCATLHSPLFMSVWR
jgi:hypothetical protein